jgi:hypothetical protein
MEATDLKIWLRNCSLQKAKNCELGDLQQTFRKIQLPLVASYSAKQLPQSGLQCPVSYSRAGCALGAGIDYISTNSSAQHKKYVSIGHLEGAVM